MNLSPFILDNIAQLVVLVADGSPPAEKVHEAMLVIAELAWIEGRADGLEYCRGRVRQAVIEAVAELLAKETT